MSKIWKLFICENIKTWKKLSTKILIIVILIALIGSLAIVKIAEKASESNQTIADSMVDDGKLFLEEAIKNIEELYSKLLEIEKKEGLNAACAQLQGFCDEKQKSYNELIFALQHLQE